MSSGPSVLHVVEAYGGGLADAVGNFIASTPQVEHHLLYMPRQGIITDPAIVDACASVTFLPRGHLNRVRATRAVTRRIRPDIVHAHSSYAGVYSRLALSARKTPIVYSPHCFAFERRDYSMTIRRAFWAIERALCRNTSVYAACSDRELTLIHRLGNRPASLIVNVASRAYRDRVRRSAPRDRSPITIAMVGRLTAQKGMDVFARVAQETLRAGAPARFVWIGGGDPASAAPLLRTGVEVTGWLPPHEVVDALEDVDLYVHTGEWEGFPVGLLEAVALGVPSLVLAREYAQGLPSEMIASDADIAGRVVGLATDRGARQRLADLGAHALADHTPESQAHQLAALYDLVLDRPYPPSAAPDPARDAPPSAPS